MGRMATYGPAAETLLCIFGGLQNAKVNLEARNCFDVYAARAILIGMKLHHFVVQYILSFPS